MRKFEDDWIRQNKIATFQFESDICNFWDRLKLAHIYSCFLLGMNS